jgi:hypothetical protein
MFAFWQSIKTGTVVVWLSHLQVEHTELSLRTNVKDIDNKNTKIVFFGIFAILKYSFAAERYLPGGYWI